MLQVWQVKFVFVLVCLALLSNVGVGLTTTQDDADALPGEEVELQRAEEAQLLLNGEKDKAEVTATGRRYEVGGEYAQQDHHAAFRERAKPLRNLFLGIYNNYKSTYLGNKTSSDYRQRLRERIQQNVAEAAFGTEEPLDESAIADDALRPFFAADTEEEGHVTEVRNDREQEQEQQTYSAEFHADAEDPSDVEESTITTTTTTSTPLPPTTLTMAGVEKTTTRHRRKPQRPAMENSDGDPNENPKKDDEDGQSSSSSSKKSKKPKKQTTRKRLKVRAPIGGDDPLIYADDDEYRYNLGPGFNMSLDMSNDIVNVNLDGDNLREMLYGRWLNDNTDEGRGKKYDMMTKVLPLFILPFLIQSAIVPFLVTKLKLLLMKSILVGKLAIFLLIVSAIRGNKGAQSYEVAPSYWAGEPSRRSELAAAASAAAYNGYRVEGKPAAWIN